MELGARVRIAPADAIGDDTMPFYEYHCQACGHDFEVFVKTMDAAAPNCASCDSADVKRKLSVFGVSAPQPPQAPPGCGGCGNSGSCPMAQG